MVTSIEHWCVRRKSNIVGDPHDVVLGEATEPTGKFWSLSSMDEEIFHDIGMNTWIGQTIATRTYNKSIGN